MEYWSVGVLEYRREWEWGSGMGEWENGRMGEWEKALTLTPTLSLHS